jgi:integrase
MPKLTTAAVEKYAPDPSQRREIRDTQAPNLYLVIQPRPSGVKSWAMRFRRPDGRPAKLTLGRVDLSDAEPTDDPVEGGSLTLRAARELANKIDRQRARGVDVVEARKAQKHSEAARTKKTFAAAAREFFVDHKTKHGTRPRRWRDDARLVGLDWSRGCDPAITEPKVKSGSLVDTWAARIVTEIDGHDVHAVVDDARRRGIPGLSRHNTDVSEARGRKMHAALSGMFRWLLQHRRVAANPATGVWHPPAPTARDRVLDDAELKILWRAAEKLRAPYGAAARVLLLTGARLNEVMGMRRAELSDDGAVWVIPSGRTKNHRAHSIPLSPLARGIIAEVPVIDGVDYVFTTGRGPATGWSRAKATLDLAMGADIAPWVLHDLRRSCASGLRRLGIRGEVIERALNHVSGSFKGVAGTYQRDPMTDEVRTALERWALHVEELISGKPAKVIPLRGRVV